MLDQHEKTAIAAHRFGLGARPGDLERIRQDPEQWLVKQLLIPHYRSRPPSSAELMRALYDFSKAQKAFKNTMADKPENPARQLYIEQSAATVMEAVNSQNPLSWRLLDFFSNHFSVSAQGNRMRVLAPSLEREAIVPHQIGHFEDMLLAVSQHPAMLVYLDNERSIGPNSRTGKQRKRGLNENLAREILELHTLGVSGGYTLNDIQELAKAITGWSITRAADKRQGFKYRANGHEPGARTVLGKSYHQKGVAQGEAILKDLARHPATARHISFKLARHFISDIPPEALVSALSDTWNKTRGNLHAVMTTLIHHPEAWQPEFKKYKTPREFFISSLRVANVKELPAERVMNLLNHLGQKPFAAGSPAGYDDTADAWNGSGALLKRIDWINQMSLRFKSANFSPRELLDHYFGPLTSAKTRRWVMGAESREQSAALFLLSPEFLRR
ncbi:MAG: DUF1800 domain-containing protein [Endozoicomonas sp.]|uniref:DUF1800 domain-containing protein n=1 Tax=Endozoicomonas sp. TaxID=1892382 RepID=UPI003D9BFC0A